MNELIKFITFIIIYFSPSGVMVFPSLGNHESFPCNSFPTADDLPPELESSWLYNGIGDIWAEWLDSEALASFRQHGFYTMEVYPGFRIITVNSNMCIGYNL